MVGTTVLMTEGFTLAEVTDLILYDIPSNKNVLQQILGRFDRLGRSSQLNVHVLTPHDSPDKFIVEQIALLRDLLAGEAKP